MDQLLNRVCPAADSTSRQVQIDTAPVKGVKQDRKFYARMSKKKKNKSFK